MIILEKNRLRNTLGLQTPKQSRLLERQCFEWKALRKDTQAYLTDPEFQEIESNRYASPDIRLAYSVCLLILLVHS